MSTPAKNSGVVRDADACEIKFTHGPRGHRERFVLWIADGMIGGGCDSDLSPFLWEVPELSRDAANALLERVLPIARKLANAYCGGKPNAEHQHLVFGIDDLCQAVLDEHREAWDEARRWSVAEATS
jgi:hypothetical protein